LNEKALKSLEFLDLLVQDQVTCAKEVIFLPVTVGLLAGLLKNC